MFDESGNLVTSQDMIDRLALKTYIERLKNRPIKDNLKNLQSEKEELCRMRLEKARLTKTPPWTMDQLNAVLKNLKTNKSRDPLGFPNEILKPSVAGKDLKVAILKLVNRVKDEQIFPKALENCNISSIYKNKGCRNNFDNYRGIFRVPVFRTIIDRLIYNDEYDGIDTELTDSNVGARKKRNVRDNINVLNVVTNSVINGNEAPIDVHIFDVEKCVDSLWLEECVNDLYDIGFQNEKLAILHLENQIADIAIKSSNGITNRASIQNIVMQGTVWGSLFCTTTMDKIGQMMYENKHLLYKYKNQVEIPSLGMVDNIMSIQKCSSNIVANNAIINSFIKSKKLRLSKTKCKRIHINKRNDKNNKKCSELKVHDDKMADSEKEKYLGDILDRTGKNRATIEDRQRKGYGLVSEILAILDEIPLGKFKMEIGLHLRQAMLLNAMLSNSEVWNALTEDEISMLERVDEHLLRLLVSGHSKTSKEFLYLESGAIPIRFIISSRRILFLHTILQRSNEELTKKVYEAQKSNPTKGDFYELVKKDLNVLNITENYIKMCSKVALKRQLKEKLRNSALDYLKQKQQEHSKIKHIVYNKLETQAWGRLHKKKQDKLAGLEKIFFGW